VADIECLDLGVQKNPYRVDEPALPIVSGDDGDAAAVWAI